MKKNSKLLPERISDALKSLIKRFVGLVLLVLGVWAVFAILFFDPYLEGFSVASTFGTQNVMGWFVGGAIFLIGTLPSLFLALWISRLGLSWLAGWESNDSPEYNLLRGFIALCVGAAGFGLILPSYNLGGMMGAIVNADLNSILGNWTLLIGFILILEFFVLVASLLRIKWKHIKSVGAYLYKGWKVYNSSESWSWVCFRD